MNVLLDLDGTLTDPKQGIVGCIQYALRSLGHHAPEEAELLRYIGPPLRDAFVELLPNDPSKPRGPMEFAEADRAVEKYRERFSTLGLFENAVYPGIPEALERLRTRGARLFLATSKPGVFARRILDHFRLSHFLDEIYGSELDGTRTDKRDLIRYILATSQLDPARTTMVGDRLHDTVGALANEVEPVGVLWGYGSRQELLGAGAKALLHAPEELGDLGKL